MNVFIIYKMFYFIRLDIFVCVGVEGWNRSRIPRRFRLEAFLKLGASQQTPSLYYT